MFLNGFGATDANNEAAFTEAAKRIYGNPNLTTAQAQQMIVQAFYDTGVSLEFAAMTFDIPVSDVQTVIDRYVNTVVFPVQAPTQAEQKALVQAAEADRQARQAAEAARLAQLAIENAKNSLNPVCPPGYFLRTEADWINFSAMAHFAPGTDMEKEKNIFLTTCIEEQPDESGGYRSPTPSTGASVSPALILAAVASYFILGG